MKNRTKSVIRILSDLLCGAAAAFLGVVQAVFLFAGSAFAGVIAAMVILPLMTLLLMHLERKHRQLRGITALLGYPFVTYLSGASGLTTFMIFQINSQPDEAPHRMEASMAGAWCMVITAMLLAYFFSSRKEKHHGKSDKNTGRTDI